VSPPIFLLGCGFSGLLEIGLLNWSAQRELQKKKKAFTAAV
jgi:hypothetical protein